MKEYLEAGKIINKRGLGGELKIESYCDTPEVFCDFEKMTFWLKSFHDLSSL